MSTDLIERLKAAEEGSRELDAEIAVAIRDMVSDSGREVPQWADQNFPTWRVARPGVVEVVHDNGDGGLEWRARRYTTSLDAALTLYKVKPNHISTDPLKACINALEKLR